MNDGKPTMQTAEGTASSRSLQGPWVRTQLVCSRKSKKPVCCSRGHGSGGERQRRTSSEAGEGLAFTLVSLEGFGVWGGGRGWSTGG